MKRYRKAIATLATCAALAAGMLLSTAGVVAADYGPGAVYQVELTANVGGHDGGGVWLWMALYPSGDGDYRGADCGHGFGAVRDSGDLTWQVNLTTHEVVISGVVLNGFGFPYSTTITVPATYGHYSGKLDTFLTLPAFIPSGIGTSQLQVAP
jgi:hypothetical protein